MGRTALFLIGVVLAALALAPLPAQLGAQADLDAFMQKVLARRDDNWKKLQQYVLDEREQIELRGPSRTPMWGERRDYIWYIRDGFFVRSPLKVNGADVPEADRVKYEREFLRRAQDRDRRGSPPAATDLPRDADSVIRQARQPQFISSAYFLRFRFEEGNYALVGHETLAGRDTLRIEYYPTRLFARERRWTRGQSSDAERARAAERERLLNKSSLVTLWVDGAAAQIVKYTFNNIAFDFLPASWLFHVDDVHATMTMGQPFPDVWLPQNIDFAGAATLALGQFDVHYVIDYHDYRVADVKSKVTIPGAR